MAATNIDYTPAGPTIGQFHACDKFVRGLMGPVGSGKSSACWMELMIRAVQQKPDYQRQRRTRWAVLRNTYPELKSTTIKTALEWAPMMIMRWDAPIVGTLDFWLKDKTRVKAEIYFLALERPEDVGKLKSLELTGAWMNEAGEMAKEVFDMVTQRVSTGRFPPRKYGGATWSGVLLDTNPPDTDHWWYKLFEEHNHTGYQVFKQPGGMLERLGELLPNPQAENIDNLNGGYAYYERQIAGKTKEWIKVYLLGQYGAVIAGKPVYPEYNDDLHCRDIEAIEGRPLLIGLDYGLTPAAVICQMTAKGQFLVLDELCAEDMGISQFARDVLKPHMRNAWRDYAFSAVGDPSGTRRAESDEKTCFMELAEAGIAAAPAISNDFLKRREAVAKYLTRLIDGKAAFLIHPRCVKTRKGFLGGYCYRRLQMAGERYRDVAEKNLYSHPHDALQYAALFTQFMDTLSFTKPIEYKEKVV